MSETTATVDLGKSRCRLVVHGATAGERSGIGAPGLAAAGGLEAALTAILPLLDGVERIDTLGVGAAGAWFAPEAAEELAAALAARTGARVAVASDVVTAHAGALDGAAGVLLIAGTGAVALGVDPSGARLVDGWGPELGDFGSGSWLGREALRAVLRAHDGLAAPTALTAALAAPVGPPSAVQAWLAADGALARRLATLAPLVLAAAAADDRIARGIVDEAVRLLAATTAAAAGPTADVALHGGLTDHDGFRAALARALEGSGRRVVPARGGAMDGALLLTRRLDLPHERFVHRAE
ncbi:MULTISPECIES: BadF/BadG/BcrA/BcrD ATPase family protein [unclassified Microbacterium]|uniref:BadF/BadG/BcrA/BcrD ATPase family protein n=1 Tax=unclassified Microbacterium TaxID=2609290 RepID=UPI0021A4FB47|nr:MULTISPECIES: BadF/BadG/BcrA/BcrD ATPase family protein [unclassified Microbacterium]MCT1363720.1 ATPase [Microbacterium sp. p3-SID131]MCT1375480.1 ATPase [Microbacterium sp. p3-SID337]